MLSSQHLQLLSAVLAIIGIIALEAIAFTTQAIDIHNFSELQSELLGKKIQIQGTIAWKNNEKNYIEYGIQNNGEIHGIKFNPSPFEKLVSIQDSVSVIGILQTHQGKLQIEIDSIQVNSK